MVFTPSLAGCGRIFAPGMDNISPGGINSAGAGDAITGVFSSGLMTSIGFVSFFAIIDFN
jgi:hypothetical protein